MQCNNTIILLCPLIAHFTTTVSRPIVNKQYLQIRIRLIYNRLNTLIQKSFNPINGNNY